jgi:hypothetical protein
MLTEPARLQRRPTNAASEKPTAKASAATPIRWPLIAFYPGLVQISFVSVDGVGVA